MHKATRVFAANALPLTCARRYKYASGRLTARAAAISPCRHTAFDAAKRQQHSDATTPTAASSSTATAQAAAAPRRPELHIKKDDPMHIDPSRLPSTIPGISQEELAARIAAYHTRKVAEARTQSNRAVAEEVELMRRSLSPGAFEAYMAQTEKEVAAAAKEGAKLAAMSPVALHHYQQKKRRQALRYEWYKTFLLVFALVGSTAFLFSLFWFFI